MAHSLFIENFSYHDRLAVVSPPLHDIMREDTDMFEECGELQGAMGKADPDPSVGASISANHEHSLLVTGAEINVDAVLLPRWWWASPQTVSSDEASNDCYLRINVEVSRREAAFVEN